MIYAVRRGWINLLDFFLPRLCCGCGARIMELNRLVCAPCMKRLPPLLEPICTRCGCPDARITGPDKCANCPPGTIWFSRARGVARFTGIAQIQVHRLKYHARTEFADALGKAMLATYCRDGDSARADLIVPVPLFSARYRQRGFNQADLLSRFMSKTLGVDYAPRALKRIRPTVSQTLLKKIAGGETSRGLLSARIQS